MPKPWKQLSTGLLLLILLAGCGTTQDHRTRVYTGHFRALDEESQAMIRAGRIDYGFDSRMVYMALGEPREDRFELTAGGPRRIWTYAGLINEDNETHPPFRTTNDLIWGSPFRQQAYDRLQVVFEDDRVTRIRPLARPSE